MEENKLRLLVVGLVVSIEFQRCKFYAERLFKSLPNVFEKPNIRGLLNVTWNEYLTKIRRKAGGRIWALTKHCVVFLNGDYLGDDDDFFKYSLTHLRIRGGVDFHVLGVKHLENLGKKYIGEGRKLVYFSVDIDAQSIGSMMFMLYSELVPLTADLFLKRCESKKHGWTGTKIHRIVKGCWLQGGGFQLKHKHIACENYIIPHDRRGVLSMCHGGKHTNNSVQYIISLGSTPWMDRKYVAFGQLIQGEEVLRKIEAVPTRYEAPRKTITIALAAEYSVSNKVNVKDVKAVTHYFTNVEKQTSLPNDVVHVEDAESNMSITRYKKGDYCLTTDLKSNLDLVQLPSFLLRLYMEHAGIYFEPSFHEGEDEVSTPATLTSGLIPIVETLEFKSTMIKSRSVKQVANEDLEVDKAEVVTRVTQLDDDTLNIPVTPNSSELLHFEEAKRLFV